MTRIEKGKAMSGILKILAATVVAGALVATVSLARTVQTRDELTGAQRPATTGARTSQGAIGRAHHAVPISPQHGNLACGSIRLDCDAIENMLAQ
jgi:hypothetical protein